MQHHIPVSPSLAQVHGQDTDTEFRAPLVENSQTEPLSNDWDSGLFSCLQQDPRLFCCALFCPCVVFAEINQVLSPGSDALDCAGKSYYNACCAYMCLTCISTASLGVGNVVIGLPFMMGCIPCGCILHNYTRKHIRERNGGIRESNCGGDVCDTVFCECCSLVQEHAQVIPSRRGDA